MISADHLTKDFQQTDNNRGRFSGVKNVVARKTVVKHAVKGVSFEVNAGELVGYLGPNGAGKSTTIKMLTGILEPTAGSVVVGGVVPWKDRRRNAHNIGVVFGQRSQLWWDLPLQDSLWLVSRLYDIPKSDFVRRRDELVELMGLREFLGTPVRQLSLGQRMRGDLAAALFHHPKVLFLDEPTVGLDIDAKLVVRNHVKQINEQSGTTVVLTTHDMEDVEQLCKRVILIDRGLVLYDGSIDQLKSKFALRRELVVHTNGDLSSITGADLVRREADKSFLQFDPEKVAASDLIREVLDRHSVTDISINEPELEDIIRGIYTGLA